MYLRKISKKLNICRPHGIRMKSSLDQFARTKIVGTIGPVSENFETLQQVVSEGLRIMRINFSHATYEEATLRINNLRACKGLHAEHGQDFNVRSILLDTQGPEIRCGTQADNGKVKLVRDEKIILTTDKTYEKASTKDMLYINYDKLASTVKTGSSVLLDDGLIDLEVNSIDGNNVHCTIKNTETLGNRKGVNLPGLKVDLPALTEKDKQDIEFGIKNDVDFVAASFVRTSKDVQNIRDFITELQSKYWPVGHPAPQIISKIENLEGLENFSDILHASDGIMVARGDLGVEIPMERIMVVQKEMVECCNHVGKPVIVATQMLESMIRNPRPTRAEVCDVGNAVLDGADAVMLSGEVAQGDYPVESVRTMHKVVKETEFMSGDLSIYSEEGDPFSDVEVISRSTVKTAEEIDAKLIIVLTETGETARMVAKQRPHVPVMCFTANQKVSRQLQLSRGLLPIISASARPSLDDAIQHAKNLHWVEKDDKVVLLSAEELSQQLGTQTMVRVAQVL